MTETITERAVNGPRSAWAHKLCGFCGEYRTMPASAEKCGTCRKTWEPSRGERVEVPGLARVMDGLGVRTVDLAHQFRMTRQNLAAYRSGKNKPTRETAETLALYLDTTLEELMKP